MGQAKKRGTFEQRQAIAIERNKQEAQEREQQEIEYERNLTPQERKKRIKARQLLAFTSMLANQTYKL